MKPLEKGIVQSETQASPVPNGHLELLDDIPLWPLIYGVPVPRVLGAPQGEACTIRLKTRVRVSTELLRVDLYYTNARTNLITRGIQK